jgi:hypothetical protein
MHQSSSATSLLGRLAARLNKPYLSARGAAFPSRIITKYSAGKHT